MSDTDHDRICRTCGVRSSSSRCPECAAATHVSRLGVRVNVEQNADLLVEPLTNETLPGSESQIASSKPLLPRRGFVGWIAGLLLLAYGGYAGLIAVSMQGQVTQEVAAGLGYDLTRVDSIRAALDDPRTREITAQITENVPYQYAFWRHLAMALIAAVSSVAVVSRSHLAPNCLWVFTTCLVLSGVGLLGATDTQGAVAQLAYTVIAAAVWVPTSWWLSRPLRPSVEPVDLSVDDDGTTAGEGRVVGQGSDDSGIKEHSQPRARHTRRWMFAYVVWACAAPLVAFIVDPNGWLDYDSDRQRLLVVMAVPPGFAWLAWYTYQRFIR